MLNLPSEYSLMLVRASPHAIRFIDNPSDILITYAIDKDPTAIQNVKAECISYTVLDHLLLKDKRYFSLIQHPTQDMLDYISWNYEDNREIINEDDYRPRDTGIWLIKNYKLVIYSPIWITLYIAFLAMKLFRKKHR